MADEKKPQEGNYEVFEEVLHILKKPLEKTKPEAGSDVSSLIGQMEESIHELEERAEELYRATGMGKDELRAFAENRDNFTDEEWKLLSDIRSEVDHFREEADRILSEEPPPPIPKGEEPLPQKQPSTRPRKKRVKKKDWLSG